MWNLGRNRLSLEVIAQSCIALQRIALNCTTIQFALYCTNIFCTSGQWPLGVIAHQSWPKRLNSGAMMQLPYALWKLNRIVKLLYTYSAFCWDNWNGHLHAFHLLSSMIILALFGGTVISTYSLSISSLISSIFEPHHPSSSLLCSSAAAAWAPFSLFSWLWSIKSLNTHFRQFLHIDIHIGREWVSDKNHL